MLTASLQTVDQQRAGRVLLAWLAGDKPALDICLAEAMADPVGPPGLLFAVVQVAARLALVVDPDGAESQLVRALLELSEDEAAAGDAA